MACGGRQQEELQGLWDIRWLPPQSSHERAWHCLFMFATWTLALLASPAASDPDRPSWKVGQSVCHSFAGFTPTDLFPIRSPLVVADFLGPQLAPHQVHVPPRALPLS